MAKPAQVQSSTGIPVEALSDAIAFIEADGRLSPRNRSMQEVLQGIEVEALDQLPLAVEAMDRLLAGEPVAVAAADGPIDVRIVTQGEDRWLFAVDSSPAQRALAVELAGRRLRVLGDLSSSLVHDLANLLLAGVGVAEALRPYVEDAAEMQSLSDMQQGVRKGAVLCRALTRALTSEVRSWERVALGVVIDDVIAVGRKGAMRRGVELSATKAGEPSIRVHVAEAVQSIVEVLLFCLAGGTTSIAIHGSAECAPIGAGRERNLGRIRVVASAVEATAAAQAMATVQLGQGMLLALSMTKSDSSGLAHAAIAMARAGGALTATEVDGGLAFDFVWPAVRPA
ncbi:MAG: hypothetical protein KDC98_16155 [Planctomycetes bacterium]|nr:hypothetical protein [Planctomycetota bacterium]